MTFNEFILNVGSQADGIARIPVMLFGYTLRHKTYKCRLTGYDWDTQQVHIINSDRDSVYCGMVATIPYTQFYIQQ